MKTNLHHKLTTKVSVKDTNATLEFITLSMQMVSKRAAHFTYDAEKIAIIHKHKYHSSNTQVQLSKKSAQQVLITTQFEELSDNRNQNRGWGIIFLLLVSSFFAGMGSRHRNVISYFLRYDASDLASPPIKTRS